MEQINKQGENENDLTDVSGNGTHVFIKELNKKINH